MKLLRVRSRYYKNCCEDFTIDFVAKSKKTSEDKEYELLEIAKDLYVYNTLAIIGKNASGKTTAISLLELCYGILSDFRVHDTNTYIDNVFLELIFFHEGYIYRYQTTLKQDTALSQKINFTQQDIARKKYYKSKHHVIYDSTDFVALKSEGFLPNDISSLFFIFKKNTPNHMYFHSHGEQQLTYAKLFQAMKTYHISTSILQHVIRIFDPTIEALERKDDKHYALTQDGITTQKTDDELFEILSSGTTKGILLYIYSIAALQNGFDLLIDEIENHFHKTLVDNLISLFKDKTVNRHNASLIFTTHYCEILDLLNRQDNIWITKAKPKIHIENMYEAYNIRSELLKSKQYYNNVFDTAVSYEDLMRLKKELMQ